MYRQGQQPVVPSHLSAHNPMFQQGYRNNGQMQRNQGQVKPSLNYTQPMRPAHQPQQQQRQRQPRQPQYRPRNVPQVQYQRQVPPVQPQAYGRQQPPQPQYPPHYQQQAQQAQQSQQAHFQQHPSQYQPHSQPPTQQRPQHQMYQQRAPPPQQAQRSASGQLQGLPVRAGSRGQYILYYSNYCLNSKEFMNILCKTPFYEKFQKINISAPNSPRPEFLKNVPTIVVPNIDRPLEGEEVFRWLETQSEQQAKAGGGDEIQPYMPGEMGMAMGGSYSYLDVDDDAKQPMEHTFVFIGRPEEKMKTPKEEEFVDAKPRPIQGVDMTNRPPMPQALQQQVHHTPSMSRPPMIPQSTAGGSNNRDDFDQAYNELINRRKMDTPVPQQRQ